MEPKDFRFILIAALASLLIPAGLITFLLTYDPAAPSVATTMVDKADASPPGNAVDAAATPDFVPNKDAARPTAPSPSEGKSAPNDAGAGPPGPTKPTDDGPRYVLEGSAAPESEPNGSDNEFNRFMADTRNDIWSSAADQANADVPAEDRYCWNMKTATVASLSLAREELSTLLDSDRFVGFPRSCLPRPQNP